MRNRAFTLVELLVAIGIIAVLASLLLTGVMRAVGHGETAAVEANLRTIGMALDAYKQDFGSYPSIDPSDTTGSRALCRCLLAPGPRGSTVPSVSVPGADGADGFGFRPARKPNLDANGVLVSYSYRGQVFGPYVQPENFRTKATDGTGNLLLSDWSEVGYTLRDGRWTLTCNGVTVTP